MVQERRPVTVLFADLVDYSSIAAREDAEDVRDLLLRYYALAREIIEAEGGIVAEYLADGVVAHFGIPAALPDGADRAVRAARRICREIGELVNGGRQMAARIGIASGAVVAEYDGRHSRITGASGLVAARLQTLAEPGGICMSETTRRLLQQDVPLRFVPPPSLKGIPDHEPVWCLDPGTRPLPTRRSLAFFGRDAEMAQLGALWAEMLRTGHATPFALLSGLPGIGKSRILREHAGQCHAPVISLQGLERHRNLALYPFAEWLRGEGGIGLDEPADVYLDALRHPETASRLQARQAPPAIRRGIFASIAGLLRRRAEQGPLMVTMEDLQWADRSTLELIGRLQRELAAHPIQWLGSARPEFAGQGALSPVLLLPLDRLSSEECARAIGEGAVPAPIAERIIARSGGVPLYLEHLLREAEDGRIGFPETVPDTLLDALLAWIDGTGPARRIVQHAAVIGRRVRRSVLAAALDKPAAALDADLDLLCQARIFQQGTDEEYAFSHDLIREAAYGTLLRRPRRQMHRRIADFYADTNPHMGDRLASEIAHHCEAAGDLERAATYWHGIGLYMTSVGAFAEGESHIRHALDCLERLPSAEPASAHTLAHLHADLAANLMQTRGFTDQAVLATYRRSLGLLGGSEERGTDALVVLWGLFTHQVLIGDMDEANTIAGRMREIHDALPVSIRRAEHSLAMLGTRNAYDFYAGRFAEQLATLDAIRRLYYRPLHAPLAARYGMDIFAAAHAFAPHSAAILGREGLARDLVAEMDAHQIELGSPLMLPFADIWGAVALGYVEDFELAVARLNRGISLADRQGAAFWSATGRMWQGVLRSGATGDPG